MLKTPAVVNDFLYVDDTAEALVLLTETPVSGVFNIGSGVGTPVGAIADMLLRLGGRPAEFGSAAVATEGPAGFFADISALEALGWRPPDAPRRRPSADTRGVSIGIVVLTRQAVILCGGRGERLRPLTDSLPKPLAPAAGRPFLWHLLGQLRDNGYREAVLLTGYRGDMIADAFGDGAGVGLKLTYRRGPEEWQTARRLWDARPLLDPQFLLLYGDNYATFQHPRVERVFREQGRMGCLTVHPRDSRANVAVTDGGQVVAYDPSRTVAGLNAVEIGYALLDSRIFASFTDANESFSAGARAAGLRRSVVGVRPGADAYQSVSDPARLAAADAYFSPKKILLVDRDGTINRKPERARYLADWADWRFVPETLEALKTLAAAGWSFVRHLQPGRRGARDGDGGAGVGARPADEGGPRP
jgi:choline kinase